MAEPALVALWVRGWARSRGVAPPVWSGGAWRVDVGLPAQRRRFVFPAIVPRLAELAATIDEPAVFLKVCAPAGEVRPVLPLRWAIQTPAFMMVTALAAEQPAGPDRAKPPDGYAVAMNQAGPVLRVTITAPDGTCAAAGHMVLEGRTAVFDRIETQAAHRRRGLGMVVMRTLTDAALACGVAEGVLVATPDGAALYRRLQWRDYADYTSAVITDDVRI